MPFDSSFEWKERRVNFFVFWAWWFSNQFAIMSETHFSCDTVGRDLCCAWLAILSSVLCSRFACPWSVREGKAAACWKWWRRSGVIPSIESAVALWGIASMHARKWIFNSPKVIEAIPTEERSTEIVINSGQDPVIKTLGISWNSTEDLFIVTASPVSPDF